MIDAPNWCKRRFSFQSGILMEEYSSKLKQPGFVNPVKLLALNLTMLAMLFISVGALGQGEYQRSVTSRPGDDILPPSPEAVALNKYVAIPVGLYTGTPQINIPIWELKEGDVTIPVSLSYHASGNKVDEIASRTGVGWTLNAGGFVTRSIVGEADEYSIDGFYHLSEALTPGGAKEGDFFYGTNSQLLNRFTAVSECVDAQPDQFSFMLPNGITGRFAFDWQTQSSNPADRIKIFCDHKVRIEPLNFPNVYDLDFIHGWRITDDDGTVYTFYGQEFTLLDKKYNPDYNCTYKDNDGFAVAPTTTWFITSAKGRNSGEVDFLYDRYDFRYRLLLSQSYNHKNYYDPASSRDYVQRMTVIGLYLRRITTGESGSTVIEFIPDSLDRTDIPARPEIGHDPVTDGLNHLNSLKEIIIKDKNGKGVKDVTLGYDYSVGRLTLKSIQEQPLDGTLLATKPPYLFTYNTAVKLPPFRDEVRFYKQDHWGYYNANPIAKLVPEYDTYRWDGAPIVYPGGDRSPDADSMKAGILTQIGYPTGGTTSFEYEPHDFGFVGNTALMSGFSRVSKVAGGLRIKKITDSAGIGSPGNNIIRKYEYKMDENGFQVSSGCVSDTPRYESYGKQLAPDGFGGWVLTPFFSRSSSSVVSLGTTQGNYVGYRQVNVLYGANGDGGKSESHFTSFYEQNDDTIGCHYKPFLSPVSFDYGRGLLTQQTDYKYGQYWDGSGYYTKTRQLDNEYDSSHISLIGVKVTETCDGCRIKTPLLVPCTDCESSPPFGYTNENPMDVFAVGYEVFRLGSTKIKKSTETFYFDRSSFNTVQQYSYDSTLHFLERSTITGSDGKEVTTEYSYPYHYNSKLVPPDLALVTMVRKNILRPVVESITQEKGPDSIRKVIDAGYTDFEITGDKVLPIVQYKFSSVAPVTDFISSRDNINTSQPDYRYYTESMKFDRYNSSGKPEQVTAKGDFKNSYIWADSGSLLIAQVSNAAFSSCAYTSFEGPYNEGNWLCSDWLPNYSPDAKTGKRSFSGEVITPGRMPAGRYIVSLWAKGTKGGTVTVDGVAKSIDDSWKRYEWVLLNPGQVDVVTNGNLIDELRLHPFDAQMKTFTYEPLLGISSATDDNHNTLYYEYDALGRLLNIRNKDGYIIKSYQYHYAGN